MKPLSDLARCMVHSLLELNQGVQSGVKVDFLRHTGISPCLHCVTTALPSANESKVSISLSSYCGANLPVQDEGEH